ncbi:FeoB small GTPase domain-containing protein [Azotobacter beijerinckii]|uniref:Small GTP-binding protein domain-containing protein n=1 Tax=Azotobacter beijerinckii TaxID=170623 RepID=A0A1I4JEW0_9GAMM|nr:FeoB small GTPase domain-containing protein [Azotobacter beijerinckii]SFB65515.1 small GTP-binding protein domain-containing protein [Azotobacter beijerinckii]SFL65102.1 small GTP-binding protein domain-containing protein [Azotobacter beijerinckii]
MKALYRIALVGNPNCGKTTLFNALTGAHQRVGNWPGVTVERKNGEYLFRGLRFEVVDLPGTYSLDVTDQEISLDEKLARDYVHGNDADLLINIVDAANLERNLYLTSQLAEMRVPLLVVLNMVDVAEVRG